MSEQNLNDEIIGLRTQVNMLKCTVDELTKNISDLKRDKNSIVGTINVMSESIEGLKQTIIHLEHTVDLKVDKH
ncbi:hypothetical protein CUC43_06280 [Bacillus thuringiensis LM1212]|uniref:hypothetical protein n=1 Tax=Bacillus cereus group TaxID=86661 RepID=UPI000401339C|nr:MULTISPECIES: hypothetical protein [Bacillus cereus group]AXY06551.1 hypothetical protein CUC43_06280 [Bacillus thuringiensis LM1212]QDF24944.1 hypothetical protein FJR70_18780 [Bacillus tropicus]QUG98260.1 hypothetical protein HCM98_26320 [Bacillus tropicus]